MVAPSLISLVRSRSLAFFLISQSAMLPRDIQDIVFMNDEWGVKNGHPYKKNETFDWNQCRCGFQT